MKTLVLSSIRKQNLRKLLEQLTFAPAMTRQEMADASGLSLMTVTNLVDLLKEQQVLRFGPVLRGDKPRPVCGRKAEAISLCGDWKAWLMVDISNLQFRLMLTGFDMHPLLEMHDDQQGDYLPRLEAFLRQAGEKVEAALAGRELLGVAVVTPGPYEIASDTVKNQRIPQLDGVQIKSLFQRCLGSYEYYVDEDVKFAVRAFADLIVQNQCEVLYYLYIGEGVGGAAVHGGNMLRGLNATAGDVGHLRDESGYTYESRLNTEAFASLLQTEISASPDQWATLRQIEGERPGDYQAALDRMAQIAAEMLHGVLWMLDPTHIMIDCAYAGGFAGVFAQQVDAALRRRFEGEGRILPVIDAASQSVSTVLRGAVYVLQREWLDRILS